MCSAGGWSIGLLAGPMVLRGSRREGRGVWVGGFVFACMRWWVKLSEPAGRARGAPYGGWDGVGVAERVRDVQWE
jgi:hypothetical protein